MPDSLRTLLEAAASRPAPEPIFAVGQRVRIRKTLEVNVHAIRHLLGKVGVVESVHTTWLHRENKYNVRVGDEVEPFEKWELDGRYIRKGNYESDQAFGKDVG